MANARRQYKEREEGNDNIHDPGVGLYWQTFEQWYDAGNYDPTEWGDEAYDIPITREA